MAGLYLKHALAAVMLGIAALALPAAAATPARPKPVQAHVIPAAKPNLLPDMSLGDPKAPITLVEYASASCPHCAHWNEEVWPEFETKYVKTGKVRYIFREVLTSPQEYAMTAFMIGRCAVARSPDPTSSAPYFAVLDSFFSGQSTYFKTNLLSHVMAEVTAKTGMTQADMQACIADEKGFSAFFANMNAHTEADGVASTPTFFVNGRRIDGHEMHDLDAAIAAAK
ncbi:DsbA family protein [Asticcacaulis sp. AC402]|uniref:DsbA family protein n=1 Tax=Asticcacaulis sp. AC402 TaxID=1282361 RepID=UPI0003C40D6A|nr:DsbA family protein [Asticcacaulis sp. AC402]ESQ76799.1 hypothetical protein ABAC402_03825 [Asticcacaulis sp. AC402]